ncbi:hypothetical protein HQQ81_15610 [Microbacteriaceae bacterium VKM Ac-2854]|nr:hypothetical protein [Microbacteriaceae bacterium VKM Ac-2854]
MSPLMDVARRWGVQLTGPVVVTGTSELQPGVRGDEPVMIKLAHVAEERLGARVLASWAGRGAVRVLELDGDAVLLVRATGPRDLARLSADGRDDTATVILCDVLERLHAVPDPGLAVPDLARWIRALTAPAPASHPDPRGHERAADILRELSAPVEPSVLLHGDAHHFNVLDFGDRSRARWLAIDPKGVRGPRVFDHLALFLNPDPATAISRLRRRQAIVAERLGRDDLAEWVFGYAMLSVAWHLEDGTDPAAALAVAAAAAELL